jgi:hypothetical protein
MNKVKNYPPGISIFVIFLISLEILYFYSFITQGLFKHYGYTLEGLTSIAHPVILIILFLATELSLVIVTYGFIMKKPWTRMYTMFFLIWASMWPVWGLIVNSLPLLHLTILGIYIIMMGYLMTESVKEFFIAIFRYGEWTLYKRFVELKSGKIILIHFFSKKIPKSGVPTHMPIGYEVMVSGRSEMPYLRKIGPHPYHYGKYTLYMRIVKLKSGTQLPIYFFSKKKPKSGKPAILPEKYLVKENSRSHMPYLIKKA